MKKLLLFVTYKVTWVFLLPFLAWSKLPISEYNAFTAPSQILSLIPGTLGILLRRVWYKSTLKSCGSNLTVDWLAVIRTKNSEVGNNCTLGVANWVGLVKIGDDVMTGDRVSLISGAKQHNFSDKSKKIREQHGSKTQITIGDDIWIGSQAIIMCDVSHHTVIGAGSVVTKTFSSWVVIAGTPAKVIKSY